MNTIIVAPPDAAVPAARALRWEGIPHQVIRCTLPTDYAAAVAFMWTRRAGFVLVEADVVPWPGAIAQLVACPEPWCGYRYPTAPGVLDGGLGCVRFNDELVRDNPRLPDAWRGVHWRNLDLTVREAITGSHRTSFHRHEPAVAHARERTD